MMKPSKDLLSVMRTGQEDLAARLVSPCGLTISYHSWYFYKFVARAGHPAPGNADKRKAFSHPFPMRGAGRMGRGDEACFPRDWAPTDAEATAWAKEIGRALGWTEYNVDIARAERNEVLSIDLSRNGITVFEEYPDNLEVAGSKSEHARMGGLRDAEAWRLRTRARREALGWTQQDLADKIGSERRETVADIERGACEPTGVVRQAIETALAAGELAKP